MILIFYSFNKKGISYVIQKLMITGNFFKESLKVEILFKYQV